MTIKDLKSDAEDSNSNTPPQLPSESNNDGLEEIHFTRLEDIPSEIGETVPTGVSAGEWVPLGEETDDCHTSCPRSILHCSN